MARALAGPQFYDCDHCEQNPWMKAALGHDGPPTSFWRKNVVTEVDLPQCPRKTELDAEGTRQAAELEEARTIYWPHYKRGFLPVQGGISEQPALTMDLLKRLDLHDKAAKARFKALQTDGETTPEG